MEWDKIADGWAAMTHRLRKDRMYEPVNIGQPQGSRRSMTEFGFEVSTGAAEPTGTDRIPPSNQ